MDKIRLTHRPLGQTGIDVSPLGLGTVKFGRNQQVKYPQDFKIPDDKALLNLLAIAKDHGINMIDTAPAYGTSEERLGSFLVKDRPDWVIVSKAGEEFVDGKSHYDFSPAQLEKSLLRTLRRLNTDYLDVFLLHSDGNDDHLLARDEVIQAMRGFKQRGLVRAIGASTKTVSGGIKALETMDIVMASYNLSHREELPVLNLAAAHKKGTLIKKALASGHIDKFKGSDPLRANLDFVFSHPGVTSTIIGTINPEHLLQNIKTVCEVTS